MTGIPVTADRSARQRTLLGAGSALVFAAAVWWLVLRLDWTVAWQGIRDASGPLLLAAVAMNLASAMLAGIAWGVLLPARGPMALRRALRATWVGSAVNSLTPANVGAVARIAFYAREQGGGASPAAAAGLAIARTLQGLSALLLFAGIAPFLGQSLPLDRRWILRLVAAIAAVIALTLLAGLAAERRAERSRLARWVGDAIAAARHAATVQGLAASFALSTLSWLGQYATLLLCARAVGLPLTGGQAVLLMATTNVGFLARLTPGNAGVAQVIFVSTAIFLGLPAAPSGATAVVLHLLQTVPVMLVAAFTLATARRRPGA